MHQDMAFQLNLYYSGDADSFVNILESLAGDFAAVPGLKWKTWFINREDKIAGGHYVFDTQRSLNRFLNSDLAGSVLSHPRVTKHTALAFEVLESNSIITRSPLYLQAPR